MRRQGWWLSSVTSLAFWVRNSDIRVLVATVMSSRRRHRTSAHGPHSTGLYVGLDQVLRAIRVGDGRDPAGDVQLSDGQSGDLPVRDRQSDVARWTASSTGERSASARLGSMISVPASGGWAMNFTRLP